MKFAIKIIKVILVIIATLSLIGVITLKIISSTVLNEAYVFKTLQTSKYYNNIYEELKSNLENYIGPSGLDENILKDICTVEDIQKDTETILGNIYEGTAKEVNTDEMKQRIVTNINKAINNEETISISKNNIDKFADTIGDEYINTISHTEYEERINNTLKKVTKIIKIGQKALFITLAISILLLIALSFKKIYFAILNIGITGLASGVFFMTANYIINNKVNVQNIKILNASISTVLHNVITDVLSQFMNISKILIVLGIICIIVGNIIKVNNTEE